ncbi:albusnodin family lasso peptide [Streptacidiphilus sp. P02-A3a]|nr:albusnodin family lasso peptide [Streptacidiphilus sp. P02-A3a]QMU68440.1 albusnodin family lasso peptide [Streptacidiphilus sp. P02-A3a]
MEDQNMAPMDQGADALIPPAVIVLGDAATLTRGSNQNSTESKQTPYD